MRSTTVRLSAGAAALALLLFVGACSSDSDDTSTSGTDNQPAQTSAPPTSAMPGEDAAASSDIVDTAVAAGDFDTLVAAVQAAGLEQTLRGEGPFTVFAPTDAAFEALPPGTVDALLQDPTGDLAAILTYHVVEGEVMAADVGGLAGQAVTTVNGATFTVNVDADGNVSLTDGAGNTVNVVQTDIETSNGVIHVIDAVLMPPASS